MKVNIILITYNQSLYIRQALDSIMMQQTDHDIEIIVADDASTDDTLDIIKEYARNSEFKFTFLLSKNNLGYNLNYKRAIEACNGDYIAIMEGDDYWSDPKRIDKHIGFLENHRECSMTFNRIVFYFQDKTDYVLKDWSFNEDYHYYTLREQIVGNKIGNLSACVFRRKIFDNLKPGLFDLRVADWMLGIIFGQYGFIAELKDPMSVYRIHGNGVWSQQNEEDQTKRLIENIADYNKYLDYKFNDDFARYENYLKRSLIKQSKKTGWKDYLPPFLTLLIKLFIPPVILKKK